MRNLYVVMCGAAMLLAGCETFQPAEFSGVVTKPRGETIDCAIGYVNALGYTLVDANRDAGFVKAEKKTSGAGTMVSVALLGSGANKYDAMTIAVYSDPTTSQSTMKITASTLNEPVTLWGGAQKRSENQPSQALIADSQKILGICGKGQDANHELLSKIVISNFARNFSVPAQLVGKFEVVNGNDSAVSSLVVECSRSGITTRAAVNVAIGGHKHVTSPVVSFPSGQSPFPDGTPECYAVSAKSLD